MKREIIPIFFSIDSSYAPLASVAISSMIENASKDYDYIAYLLYQDLKQEDFDRLKSLEKDNLKIEFVPMTKGLESITDRDENKLRCDFFTLTIYFRLFIPQMFPQYDKVVYIDSDVVVTGDISKLYNTDLKDNYIAACPDYSIQEVPELVSYLENAIGVPRMEYVNSGVLVMDAKTLRQKEFDKEFLRLLNTFHFDSVAPDQDYINAMCNGKIKYLDESWDVMPNNNKEEFKNPNLIHYNLFFKPWFYDNIQYEDIFWGYAKDNVYYNDILKIKESYSDKDKESDDKCFANLINKARSIEHNDITFKKMYEKGEKIRL